MFLAFTLQGSQVRNLHFPPEFALIKGLQQFVAGLLLLTVNIQKSSLNVAG
jgi:hypothetical protein